MNFDLNQIQSTTSPLALLSTLQGAAPSDAFATLLESGAPVSITDGPSDPVETKATATFATPTTATKNAMPAVVATESAIAHADALVSTLAPEQEQPEIPAKQPTVAQPQIVLPPMARPVTRRELPMSLPKEEPVEDRHAPEQGSDNGAPVGPIIQISPETQNAPIKIVIPVAPPMQQEATPAKRAESPKTMRGTTDRVRLPETLTRNAADRAPALAADVAKPLSSNIEPVPVEKSLPTEIGPGPAEKPVSSEIKPAPVEKLLAERPLRTDTQTVAQAQSAPSPKAAPIRATKIAEIALGLADMLANPATIAAQKGAADIAPMAPGSTPATITGPVPVSDTIVDRQLDLVRNEQWLGELAHDIASTSGDNNRLSFRLMPHQLGRLDVDVTRSHNGLSLAIHAESDGAQAILVAAQSRLADEIRAQGLKLADTQMFSGDARQSPGQDAPARPAPLIESYTIPTEIADLPEPEQRDGRYA